MDTFDFRLKHPCTIAFCGASRVGKTHALVDMLLHADEVFDTKFDKIVIVFSVWQDILEELKARRPDTVFVQSTEEAEEHLDSGLETFYAIDDAMLEFERNPAANKYITDFFCRRSHHSKTTVAILIQNLFVKTMRPCLLQTCYLCIFNPIRDKIILQNLNKQFSPGSKGYIVAAMKIATETNGHQYLLFDFTVDTPDQ